MNMLARFCVLALLGAASAPAMTDFWVNPLTGDDAATGTSAAAALRTLTEASGRAASGDRVLILPGTLNGETGELFPIQIPANVCVESTAGADETTVDVEGLSSGIDGLIRCDRGSSLTGVTVTGGDAGVIFHGSPEASDPSVVRSCVIDGGWNALCLERGGIAFEDCVLRDQREAVLSLPTNASISLRLTRCEVAGRETGLAASVGLISSGLIELDRCVFRNHTRAGIRLDTVSFGGVSFELSGCLFEGNRSGIESVAVVSPSFAQWTIEHCTFVNNDLYGAEFTTSSAGPSRIDSTVFWGNGQGGLTVDSTQGLTVHRSNLQENFSGGGTGNLLGDPGFLDASSGDYSLRADSPCVDAGSVTASLPAVDILGRRRIVDGNLDLDAVPDMGALELSPLVGPFSIVLGTPAIYGVSGQAGGFSTIVVAPNGFGVPSVTQYGTLFLDGNGAFRLTPVMTTGGGPTWVDIGSFVDPSWVGTTVGLQALTRSSAAPAGGAFSNPIPVSVR